jgi:hypothetical protein
VRIISNPSNNQQNIKPNLAGIGGNNIPTIINTMIKNIKLTSCLIQALCNKVNWKTFHKIFIIYRKWIMTLSEWH